MMVGFGRIGLVSTFTLALASGGCARDLPAGASAGESGEEESGDSDAELSTGDSSESGDGDGDASEAGTGDGDGDGDSGETGIPDPVFPDALDDIPGVVSVEPIEGGFRIGFEQPVDHFAADSDTFVQYLSLRSDGFDGPMILRFTGYYDYIGTSPGQLSFLVPDSNQLVVEHRYFGDSVPEPTDWNFLSVEQAAADHHAIVEAFKLVYRDPWFSIGASKGGQTVLELEQLYPEDIDAVVALVAPIIPALYDPGFDPFVNALASSSCGQEARALHVALLERRDELMALAMQEAQQEGLSYTHVGIEAALDIAIAEWEFVFWQYTSSCADLPAPDASASALFDALGGSSPSTYSDGRLAPFMPFFHQCRSQLGYPGVTDDHLMTSLFPVLTESYLELLIPADADVPAYDATAMTSLADWIADEAEGVVLIYGAFDPWSARAVEPSGSGDALYYFLEGENHGANLFKLSDAQRSEVCEALNAWTGLTTVCAEGFVDVPTLRHGGPARL